jgi:hypothetical protein
MSGERTGQASSGNSSNSTRSRNSGRKEETTRFTVDLPDPLHKRIKVQSTIEEERSMKALVIEAVEQYLERNE